MKPAETVKKILNAISEKTKLSKKLMVVLLLFFLGLVALIASEFQGKKEETLPVSTTQSEAMTADEYAARLEERLVSILSAIDGAGAVRVMVTIESGGEEVYLYNSDYGENVEMSQKSSFEQNREYVIIGEDGEEKGIVVSVIEPKVRGVAVVCEGAGSDAIKQQIIQTVTALLDISSARVSVVKMQ